MHYLQTVMVDYLSLLYEQTVSTEDSEETVTCRRALQRRQMMSCLQIRIHTYGKRSSYRRMIPKYRKYSDPIQRDAKWYLYVASSTQWTKE